MRYLGIDYGTKKTGLALSDEAGRMGFPHAVVPTAEIEATLIKVVKDSDVGAVVMGESRDLSGAANPVAADAAKLATWITDTLGLPVSWEAEFYTSAEARRARDLSVQGRSPKNTDAVDASAAALILTSYLGKHHD
ncbi:MAG TPA: Holliday junction resolvase RuvX [Candidatus Paceibacterota bacterium]|nr:Holliday junction resolvase RuvX [Candidatus Paceibacterota bacterium]